MRLGIAIPLHPAAERFYARVAEEREQEVEDEKEPTPETLAPAEGP